jgi:glutathione S-transferase
VVKLYFNRPSPYARKVRVVIHEKQLVERIDWHEVDPWLDPPELITASPLGKVPALVADDGTLFTESSPSPSISTALAADRRCSPAMR